MSLDRYGLCPHCSKSWDGGDILETLSKLEVNQSKTKREILTLADYFGYTPENQLRFSRLIGVNILKLSKNEYFFNCPHCDTTWNKETGEQYPKLKDAIATLEPLLNIGNNIEDEKDIPDDLPF